MGIAYKGIAFPILWSLLPKAGNSNTEERIALLQRFISIFGKERFSCLLADREFVGRDWFNFLQRENLSFRIRIKQDTLIYNSRKHLVNAYKLFSNLKPNQYHVLSGKQQIWDNNLHIAATKLSSGSFLIIVSSDSPETIFSDYAKRWEIETLFGCLKKRGFRFEDTHLTEPERIAKLMALLAIAFTWAYLVGEWLLCQNQQTIPLKKTINRPLKSVFRHGLDYLRKIILNIQENFHNFVLLTKLLSCT